MKHLKTFESFSLDTDSVGEGLFDKFFKPPVNPTKKKIITKAVKAVDTEKVKFMQVKGDDKSKTNFSVDGYLKMAEKSDNFNGSFGVKGDIAFYTPGNWSSSSGGFKGTGGMGG